MPTPTYTAGREYPMFNLPGKTPGIGGSVSAMGVPGFNRLSSTATGNIQNLLSGVPSAAPTQRANAYFGASSGMPGSDFVRNRGFDLYGEKSEDYKQRGLQDFLSLLQGYSGTVMPTAGQQLETQQFNANLGNRQREFDVNQANQQQAQNFNELQWGKDRPWNTTSTGDILDRTNKRLGYGAKYDRGILI
jgi:hypothetical protein